MLLLRLPGELLLRFADRTLWALLLKLPPRLTRLEPVSALTLKLLAQPPRLRCWPWAEQTRA